MNKEDITRHHIIINDIVCSPGMTSNSGQRISQVIAERECTICGDLLNYNNYVAYRYGQSDPWRVSTGICGSCTEDWLESQNQSYRGYLDQLCSLDGCSRVLRQLISGQEGLPVYARDLQLFPPLNVETVPNQVEPTFGRWNEVYQLSVGHEFRTLDPHLEGAPTCPDQMFGTVRQIIDRVTKELTRYDTSHVLSSPDYDQQIVTDIRQHLVGLEECLQTKGRLYYSSGSPSSP